MQQINLISSLFVLLLSFFTLGFLILTIFKSGDKTLADFSFFFTVFSLSVLVQFASSYLALIGTTKIVPIAILKAFSVGVSSLIVVSYSVFVSHLAFARARRKADVVLVAIAVICLVLFLSPIGSRIDAGSMSVELLPPAFVALAIYYLLFVYGAAATVIAYFRQKGNAIRKVLVPLFLFLMYGLVESSIKNFFSGASIKMSPEPTIATFYFSSIPYAFLCVYLVFFIWRYYFRPDLRNAEGRLDAFSRDFRLSEREKDILNLLARGFSNREIGDRLFISVATVKTHVHNLLEKTASPSRNKLIYLLKRHSREN